MQTALSGTASRAGPPFDLSLAVLGGVQLKNGMVLCRIFDGFTNRTFYNYQVSGMVGCILKLYGHIDADTLLRETRSTGKVWAGSVRAAAAKLNDLMLHGAILCDEVGLGKTLQSLGVALLHIFLYDVRDKDGKVVFLPTLLVVPPTLVNQWLLEIRTHWPCFLVVISYDDHEFKEVMALSTIPHSAMKEYPHLDALPKELRYIHDRSDKRAKKVLKATSYETHKARTAEKKSKKHPGVPYNPPRFNDDSTPRWKQLPRVEKYYVTKHSDAYSLGIFDEAQKVKNFATGLWTILFLHSFYKTLAVTATPLYNSVKASFELSLKSTFLLGNVF